MTTLMYMEEAAALEAEVRVTAVEHEGDATYPSRATVFPKECCKGSAGDPFDDALQAPFDVRRIGRPGTHDGVVRLTGRGNGRVGKRDGPPVHHAGGASRALQEHDGGPTGLDAAAEDGRR